ncbi:MAG: potassium transporter TrkG [Actinomycetaceae bacterium]|nr:potassium transporter TrkG [Actinomycetaceae bacterium]
MAHLRNRIDHFAKTSPARLALTTFALIISTATALLSLPAATQTGHRAPFVDALFNATSAVCVTGLVTVDTATYWSVFGQVVLLFSMKIGGLGVMTLASLLALAVSRHIGLTQRMLAATETKTASLGAVGSLIKAVIIVSSTCELLIFLVLLPRFITLNDNIIMATWHALFMAFSIFNNAGFVVLPEGMEAHAGDWWFVTPVIVGTALGAIGFPVSLNLWRHWHEGARITLHTKLTLTTYGGLFLLAAVLILSSEFNNPRTFAELPWDEKIQAAMLFGVNSRSSGLSTIDVGQMTRGSWYLIDLLMFIGGGSASTAGGIKVTTLAVLVMAVIAETRGDRDIEAFDRRIPASTVRLAVAVTGIGALFVGTSIFFLLNVTEYSLDVIGFEVISAFGTVGLSTGITPDLPSIAKYVLTALMFAGRTGTMTVAAALALRERKRVIRMPEERPAIG